MNTERYISFLERDLEDKEAQIKTLEENNARLRKQLADRKQQRASKRPMNTADHATEATVQ
jgi:hypothetical protein